MIGIAIALVATLVAVAHTATASAQPFPSKPVTIVVPFAAGGPIDTTTRILAERMKAPLGQSIVVENVAGASGSIAAGRVARAAPDGYTIIAGIWGTHVANGAIYPLQYDLQKVFAPVALISSNPLLIVSKSALPAENLAGLIAWLKQNPDTASQGTSGAGSVGHIAGAFFQRLTGTHYRFVPYRGLGPAMQDLVSGQIELIFDTPATSLSQVKSGAIRAYAVTAKMRLSAAPEIPTVDEAALPGFYVSTWTAVFAPGNTPAEIISRLNAAAVEALGDTAVQMKLARIGQETFPREQQTPAALATYQQAEIEKWWPIIKAARIKGE